MKRLLRWPKEHPFFAGLFLLIVSYGLWCFAGRLYSISTKDLSFLVGCLSLILGVIGGVFVIVPPLVGKNGEGIV